MPIDFRRFTLPIQVLPKHDGQGFDGRRHYVPRKKHLNALAIRLLARQYAPPEPWTGPIQLDIHCVRKTPRRIPKGQWEDLEWTEIYGLPHCEGPPDVDNQMKQAWDAIEGLFFVNDYQVSATRDTKSWGIEGCVHIFVAQLTPAEHRVLVRQWWNE